MSHFNLLNDPSKQEIKSVDERFVWKGERVGTTRQGFPLYDCRSFLGRKQGPCVMVQDVLRARHEDVRTNLFGRLQIEGRSL